AIQIMTALIHHCLAVIWTYLLVSQIVAFGETYLPLAILSGYPYWSPFFYIMSGSFAIMLEKRRSKFLVSYTLVTNILSACIAVIGLLIITLEFVLYHLLSTKAIWPQQGMGVSLIISSFFGVCTF
uniref:Membrane spanning 4-domains A5 n=1 Tax=Loxodonta africana TaxID=9785 RepID=G3U9U0_LOXAF